MLLGFNGATTMSATFAPANAADEVKVAVDHVSPYEDGDGVSSQKVGANLRVRPWGRHTGLPLPRNIEKIRDGVVDILRRWVEQNTVK